MTSDPRVLVTAVPFGLADRRPLDLLDAHGIPFVQNPVGRTLREGELIDLAGGVAALIAGTEPITERVLAAVPSIRLVSRVGIGLDSVDLLAARARGVQVSYTPDAPAPAVAELTIGLILALLRQVGEADRLIRRGGWHRSMGRRLARQTVGILGVGRVGGRVARLLRGAFPSVRMLGHDLRPDLALGRELGLDWVDAAGLLGESDVVTVHVPLTRQTSGMIGARELASMKPSAILVNTARGGIVDEGALARALGAGRLGGAALDVFGVEPYEGELVGVERCLLTCHMGSMTDDCRARMELEAAEDVVRFLSGEGLARPVPEEEYRLRMADGSVTR